MQALFAITVFLAAALLFVVEPMFARMALPLLGGAPSVWNTAMVFYQATLLAGYGLAHLVATRLSLRRQALAQILLIAAPVALLPLGISAGWAPPAPGPRPATQSGIGPATPGPGFSSPRSGRTSRAAPGTRSRTPRAKAVW